MNQTFKTIEDIEFTLQSPIIKNGYAIANIRSQIRDLFTSSFEDLVLQSKDPKIQEMVSELIVAKKDNQDISLILQELETYTFTSPIILAQAMKNSIDFKALYAILNDILTYYKEKEKLDNAILPTDVGEQELYKILKYLAEEPKNQLQDFLTPIKAKIQSQVISALEIKD
jgi:hypothetical protein